MATEALALRRETAISEEGLALIERLTTELDERYGPVTNARFSPDDIRGVAGAIFVVAMHGEQPVGCGALRPIESGIAEIKRMYVAPDFRGRRIAREILRELERFATEFGYRSIRLETGDRQPEAVRLYEQVGYARIPCYGIYASLPWSICFEKLLGSDDER